MDGWNMDENKRKKMRTDLCVTFSFFEKKCSDHVWLKRKKEKILKNWHMDHMKRETLKISLVKVDFFSK